MKQADSPMKKKRSKKTNNKKKDLKANETNLPTLKESVSSGLIAEGLTFYRLNFIKPLSRDKTFKDSNVRKSKNELNSESE